MATTSLIYKHPISYKSNSISVREKRASGKGTRLPCDPHRSRPCAILVTQSNKPRTQPSSRPPTSVRRTRPPSLRSSLTL